jgi:nitroreductase
MNETIKTIFERASIRAYSSEPLTESELETLAKCALAAPTARNIQTRRFYFITNKVLINEIEREVVNIIYASGDELMIQRTKERNEKVIYDAPLLVVVAVDKSNKYSAVDAGIAVATLSLAAKSMGLDSVILGMPAMAFTGPRREYFKERLGMPKELEFETSIAIGHKAMEKAPHEFDMKHVIFVK